MNVLRYKVSAWCVDGEAHSRRRGSQPLVVRHDGSEIGSDELRRRKVDGVEAAKQRAGSERCCRVEERSVDADLMQAGKLTACLGDGIGAAALDGPHDFDA